jgi:hypothetical protein
VHRGEGVDVGPAAQRFCGLTPDLFFFPSLRSVRRSIRS